VRFVFDQRLSEAALPNAVGPLPMTDEISFGMLCAYFDGDKISHVSNLNPRTLPHSRGGQEMLGLHLKRDEK